MYYKTVYVDSKHNENNTKKERIKRESYVCTSSDNKGSCRKYTSEKAVCRSITDISLLDREEKAMFIKIRENYLKKKLHAERESYEEKNKATWRRRKLRVERESYADKNKATWRRRKLR